MNNAEEVLNLVREVKSTHSSKEPHSRRMFTPFTQEERIKFACDYYSIMGSVSFLDLFAATYDYHSQTTKDLREFMSRYDMLKKIADSLGEITHKISCYESTRLRDHNINLQNLTRIYNRQNWLEEFNPDLMFEESKTKHPAYHICLDTNGNPIRFDKARSTQIKCLIKENGIFPARCIIEGAYNPYAQGTLDEYIAKIKSLRR